MIPTVFVNSDQGVIVNWHISGAIGFQEELIPEYASFELAEAYCNVVSVIQDFYDEHFALGIALDEASFREVTEREMYLSGDSLGAAWLLGAMCRFFGRTFPQGILAWGALKPTRNGGFALLETGGTELKTKSAEENGFSKIFVHRDEVIPRFNGEIIRFSGDLTHDLKILEHLIWKN